MLELPEAFTIAGQINSTILGKTIMNVTAAQSPHKFAWFFGEPEGYHGLLSGKTVERAEGFGGMVEIKAGGAVILVGDGVGLRYHAQGDRHPQKHQLLIEFEDFSAVSASVQMYGGIWCFKEGELDNPYYKVAKEKPSPITPQFDRAYYDSLISLLDMQKLSAKAFLATEQRIPGLGNGVLQDILYNCGIHPKRKVSTLDNRDIDSLFNSIKSTLSQMVFEGGRDTERDLFGCYGGYRTRLCKNTVDKPCGVCGSTIRKASYMGGSIYFCEGCQRL
ncbi:formamidopyrimidine-DNA glycosylase [Anaerobacterium chartisolvens]|uniref:Formamidopyrimidine-DNA glycosylase n=1 Tax=Anaerobacterium chartisolvens TaxID=1297424 RepID=A0A369BD84_9FIRM|nr:endonuclease VIII [Anaerobacterium chartisolvens]RCX18417.1 formamidopyrimidine-DNA glycosylase [Anaerobacterium chartisolvens]